MKLKPSPCSGEAVFLTMKAESCSCKSEPFVSLFSLWDRKIHKLTILVLPNVSIGEKHSPWLKQLLFLGVTVRRTSIKDAWAANFGTVRLRSSDIWTQRSQPTTQIGPRVNLKMNSPSSVPKPMTRSTNRWRATSAPPLPAIFGE